MYYNVFFLLFCLLFILIRFVYQIVVVVSISLIVLMTFLWCIFVCYGFDKIQYINSWGWISPLFADKIRRWILFPVGWIAGNEYFPWSRGPHQYCQRYRTNNENTMNSQRQYGNWQIVISWTHEHSTFNRWRYVVFFLCLFCCWSDDIYILLSDSF